MRPGRPRPSISDELGVAQPWTRAEERRELAGGPGSTTATVRPAEARAQRIGPGLAPAREDVGPHDGLHRGQSRRPRAHARSASRIAASPRCARPRRPGGHRSRREGECPRSTSAPSRSATADSPMPVRRSVSAARSVPRPRAAGAARRGRATSACSSRGGPGNATKTASPVSTHQPGAVPLGFGRASAPGMSQACLRFEEGKGMPRRSQSSRSQRLEGRIDRRLHLEDGGDGFARQVIGRRAQAARGDDQVGPVSRHRQGFRDGLEVIVQERRSS